MTRIESNKRNLSFEQPRWSIEAAVSLMVFDEVVGIEKWKQDPEIKILHRKLLLEVREIFCPANMIDDEPREDKFGLKPYVINPPGKRNPPKPYVASCPHPDDIDEYWCFKINKIYPYYDSEPIEGYIVVQTEGIKKWSKFIKYHSKIFYPAPLIKGAGASTTAISIQETPVTSETDNSGNNIHNLVSGLAKVPLSKKMTAAIKVIIALHGADKEFSRKSATKDRITKWLKARYKDLDLVKSDGTISNKAITEITNVANWNISGGSPKQD